MKIPNVCLVTDKLGFSTVIFSIDCEILSCGLLVVKDVMWRKTKRVNVVAFTNLADLKGYD